MARWLNVLGTDIAAYLDEHGMPGAVNRVGFDNWYPGFLDFTHIFRNSISFFTETALYRYATPRFYTVDEFPKDQRGLALGSVLQQPVERRVVEAARRGELHGRRVDGGAGHGGEISRRIALQPVPSRGGQRQPLPKEPPFAYVIPQEQRDLPEAATLVQKLMINGIEVQQADQSLSREWPRISAGHVGRADGPALFAAGEGAVRAAAISGPARNAERPAKAAVRRDRMDAADADGSAGRARAGACARQASARR